MDLLLQQLFNGLITGSTYALVALGFTLVLGTLDLLNFAHGETIMVCAYAALLAETSAALRPALAEAWQSPLPDGPEPLGDTRAGGRQEHRLIMT